MSACSCALCHARQYRNEGRRAVLDALACGLMVDLAWTLTKFTGRTVRRCVIGR